MRGTTIRQEQYESLKDFALKQKYVRNEIPLSSINIVSDKEIQINGMSIGITSDAFRSLIKFLGINKSFLENFEKVTSLKTKNELIHLMRNAVVSNGKKTMITAIMNTESKMIENFVSIGSAGLSTNSFFKLFEDVMNNHKNMVIKNMSVRGSTVEISVVNPNWEFNVGALKDEFFHAGLVFIQTPTETVVCPFNERLVCTNGMVVNTKGTSIVLKHTDANSVNGFITTIREIKGQDYFVNEFKSKVMKLINTVASYNEMRTVYSNVSYHVDMEDPYVKMKVNQFIDVDYVFSQYLNNKFDLNKVPTEMWKKVKSDMSVWELINVLTDLSSHAQQYGIRFKYEENYSVFQLQKVAGELFVKDPLDLEFESLIPKIDFATRKVEE